MLADCVGAAKYCDISIVLGIALEPMRRLHRIVASAYGIYQTQSPSLRVYVKEFMTGFVVFTHNAIHFVNVLIRLRVSLTPLNRAPPTKLVNHRPTRLLLRGQQPEGPTSRTDYHTTLPACSFSDRL